MASQVILTEFSVPSTFRRMKILLFLEAGIRQLRFGTRVPGTPFVLFSVPTSQVILSMFTTDSF